MIRRLLRCIQTAYQHLLGYNCAVLLTADAWHAAGSGLLCQRHCAQAMKVCCMSHLAMWLVLIRARVLVVTLYCVSLAGHGAA